MEKDALWEKGANSGIEFQNKLADLLTREIPKAEELILIQRDLQITMIEMRTEEYYFLREHIPSRIIRNQGWSRWANFECTNEDKEKILKINERYKNLENKKEFLMKKNQGHPMWPLIRDKFAKIGKTPEYQEIEKRVRVTLEDIDIKLNNSHSQFGMSETSKTYFYFDEYGFVYWIAEGEWKHNWLLKPNINFKFIQVVLNDEDNNEEVMIDTEIMNHSPIWFGFRFGQPQLTGSKINPHLSIPFSYSRIGYKPIGVFRSADIKGLRTLKVVCNEHPIIDKSGKTILATITTEDSKSKYQYKVLLIYETE